MVLFLLEQVSLRTHWLYKMVQENLGELFLMSSARCRNMTARIVWTICSISKVRFFYVFIRHIWTARYAIIGSNLIFLWLGRLFMFIIKAHINLGFNEFSVLVFFIAEALNLIFRIDRFSMIHNVRPLVRPSFRNPKVLRTVTNMRLLLRQINCALNK